MGRRLNEFGQRVFTQESNTYRLVGGIDGTLGDWSGPLKGWAWDTSFVYGSAANTTDNKGSLRSTRIGSAIGPSMFDPATGKAVCVQTPGDLSTAIDGCVPLNLFGGAGTITPDMVGGLGFDGTDKAQWNMSSLELSLNGELFKLMSDRPSSLAAGYEYRREWGYTLPNTIAASGESSGSNYNASTPGGFNSSSFYGELSIPLVSNVPGAEEVELDASARASHYSNFGNNTTYKLGARWSPLRDITLRGTYSTAFRAPSILELFAGQADSFETAVDPCADPATAPASCGPAAGNNYNQNQVRSLVGGNPGLKPEEAKIWTVGLVYQPRQIEGLSFTADYYLIDVSKTITTVTTPIILDGCYKGGNQAYCALITRNPDNAYRISRVVDTNLNAGKLATAGLDLALRYDLRATPARTGQLLGRRELAAEVRPDPPRRQRAALQEHRRRHHRRREPGRGAVEGDRVRGLGRSRRGR